MGFLAPSAPAAPPPPPPPPPPVAVPVETDPSVQQRRLEDQRQQRNRRGRASTALSGPLGDSRGDGTQGYAAPTTRTATVLG